MNRQEANRELLNELKLLIEKQPDSRWSQILQNYGFVKPLRPVKDPSEQYWQNEFYTEGDVILKRVKGRLDDSNS